MGSTTGSPADGTHDSPNTTTYLPSVLDQTVGRYYVHRIFTFNFPDTSHLAVTEASVYIQDGLELTFARYPVLAGFLGPCLQPSKKNLVEVVYIEQTNIKKRVTGKNFKVSKVDDVPRNGVEGQLQPPFYELVARGMPASDFPAEFFCYIPKGDPSKDWVPAFTLKATVLTEAKALVLGFVFQHTLTDGTAMSTVFDAFVKNMQEAAKGKGNAPVPYERPSLSSYLQVMEDLDDTETAGDAETQALGPAHPVPKDEFAVSSPILVFSAPLVKRTQSWANEYLHKTDRMASTKQLSKTDCLSGLIWVAVSRARAASSSTSGPAGHPSQLTYFRTAVNARGRLSPPLPGDYFGNMFEHATTQSTLGAMALRSDPHRGPGLSGASFRELVAEHALKVRSAVEAVDDASVRRRLTRISQLEDFQDTASAIPAFDKVHGLDFGSLVLFGADLQFNIPGTAGHDGRAEFCRKVMPGKEGIANVLPRRGGTQGDADWEVVVSLRADHSRKMIEELAGLQLIKRVCL